MALRIPIRSTDTTIIYLPSDDAIDEVATGADAIRAYFGCRDLDPAPLRFHAGKKASPTTIRALTEHEALLTQGEGSNVAHGLTLAAQLALVHVEGLPEPRRALYCGRPCVALDWLEEHLAAGDVVMIGQAARAWSTMTAEKKTRSI